MSAEIGRSNAPVIASSGWTAIVLLALVCIPALPPEISTGAMHSQLEKMRARRCVGADHYNHLVILDRWNMPMMHGLSFVVPTIRDGGNAHPESSSPSLLSSVDLDWWGLR